MHHSEIPMTTSPSAPTAAVLYHAILAELIKTGQMVPGARTKDSPGYNRASVELRGFRFRLENPRTRWINSNVRPLNIPFCFGLGFYFLHAATDVASIEYYNPLASKFTDDGVTIPGSSYGARVAPEYIIKLLQDDPTTRRAVIPIFSLYDYRDSKDIPCPVGVQFLIRNNLLHCVSYFRSQNALTVFPYDLFLFTWIQEYFAVRLGLDVGDYIQATGSMHVYEDELKLLGEEIQKPLGPPYEMASMTPFDQAAVLALESGLRRFGLKETDVPPVIIGELQPYWKSIYNLLLEFAYRRRAGERHLRDLSLIQRVAPNIFAS